MSVELLQLLVVAVVVIVLINSLASRLGVAGPLCLVVVGILISWLPFVPPIAVAPELILVGVLPPLLYSAAVSAPAIEFRRDFGAIGGLAVLLVVISALVLGVFFVWAVPGLSFPLAVALGAILSPTDAVATSIVKKLGVSRRVVTLLEGESLFNDATALVLLRTAIAAVAAGFSLSTTIASFIWAVLSAVIIGAVVGCLTLRLRAWINNAVANTAMGFTVPYIAYLLTEAVGGSGLVAAVTAGVVVGQGAMRWLTPEQRISDKLNWRTIEFVFEGAVFLVMGLELYGIFVSGRASNEDLVRGTWIAAIALVILVLIRAIFMAPLIRLHTWRVRRLARNRLRVHDDDSDASTHSWLTRTARRTPVLGARVPQPRGEKKTRADMDYFESSPLAWQQTVLLVWAGMRGVVTLAAAQTLPRDAPERDFLVFIAFMVAAGSLLIQGLTLPPLARWLGTRGAGVETQPREEILALGEDLREAVSAKADAVRQQDPDAGDLWNEYSRAESAEADLLAMTSGESDPAVSAFRLEVLSVMRKRLAELARTGSYSTSAVQHVLDELDASELSLRMRLNRD